MTSEESFDSNAVEVDGICFETLVPERVFKLPQKKGNAGTSVQIGMNITNNTSTPLHFSGYCTLIPELLQPNGQVSKWGRNSNVLIEPLESDFPLVMPEESISFFPDTTLFRWDRNQFGLSIHFGDGSVWVSDELKPGIYRFRFSYQKFSLTTESTAGGWESIESRLLEKVWSGWVDTPFVELHLNSKMI